MFNCHSNAVINGKWCSYLLINCNIELYFILIVLLANLNYDSSQTSKKNSGLASFGRFWPLFGSYLAPSLRTTYQPC